MTKQRGNREKITYGQLNQALTALGFTRKKTEDFIVFREAKHEALILLPKMTDRSLLGDPHLITVSNTVTGKGVATREHLYALLRDPEATRSELTPLVDPQDILKRKMKLRAATRRLSLSASPKPE